MRVLKWFDRHLWATPLAILAILQVVHIPTVSKLLPTIVLTEDQRLAALSSIAGAAGTFSGLALAIVAILASPASPRAKDVGKARTVLALLMLIESLLFLITAVLTVALIVYETCNWGPHLLLTLTVSTLIGLLIGGAAFALAILESHNPADD